MNVLMMINSNDPEIKWNALRFANLLLNEGEDVTIFLNNHSVSLYEGDSGAFPIAEQAKIFSLSEGVLLA